MDETTFELRKLEATDIAPMASILAKIGVKEFKSAFASEEMKSIISNNAEAEGDMTLNVGMAMAFDIAGTVLANYGKCENDIFNFIASLSGKEAEEIRHLPLDTFTEMVIAVIQKQEFKGFIRVVSKLLK